MGFYVSMQYFGIEDYLKLLRKSNAIPEPGSDGPQRTSLNLIVTQSGSVLWLLLLKTQLCVLGAG